MFIIFSQHMNHRYSYCKPYREWKRKIRGKRKIFQSIPDSCWNTVKSVLILSVLPFMWWNKFNVYCRKIWLCFREYPTSKQLLYWNDIRFVSKKEVLSVRTHTQRLIEHNKLKMNKNEKTSLLMTARPYLDLDFKLTDIDCHFNSLTDVLLKFWRIFIIQAFIAQV